MIVNIIKSYEYFIKYFWSGSSYVLVVWVLGPDTPLDLCGRLPAGQRVVGVGQPLHQHHLHPARPPHRSHRPTPPSPLLWQASVLLLSKVNVNQVYYRHMI